MEITCYPSKMYFNPFFLQSEDSANFSLVEVLLDKGVTEREMASDEKPWQILIDKRMVGNFICSHYSLHSIVP